MRIRGLLRRGNRYYFRVRIPADLRHIFGRTREYKVSLKTSDPAEARLRAIEEALRAERDFDRSRRGALNLIPRSTVWRQDPDRVQVAVALRGRTLTELFSFDDAFIDGFCCSYLRSGLDEDADRRTNPNIGGSLYVEFSKDQRQGDLEELRSMLGNGELAPLRPRLEYFLSEMGYKLVGEPEGYGKLLVRFTETLIREHEVLDARAKGRAFDTETIAPLARCLVRPGAHQRVDLRMADLLDHWKIGKKRRDKTIAEYTSIAHEFSVFFGEKRKVAQVTSLTKSDAVAFRDSLFESGLHYKTVRKKIGALNTVFRKARNDAKIETNPFDGVTVAGAETDDKPREIFTLDDLRQIFSSRIYTKGYRPTGCGGDAVLWVPLIGLFTGMRIEEICQLRVADLERSEEFGYYIRIDDDDGKWLKNVWSRRIIPVHPELIRLGLVDFILDKRTRSERMVFSELGLDKYRRQSSRFSKVWNAELKNTLGIPKGRSERTFHSFRHTFKHVCRECRIPEDVHDALTGHKGDKGDKNVSRGYGHKFYPMLPLFQEIRRYTIRGLDLSHLNLNAARSDCHPVRSRVKQRRKRIQKTDTMSH